MNCPSPTRPCKCCVEGKPCCYELQLDARDRGKLAWLEQYVGDEPRAIDLTKRSPMTEQRRKTEIEPMTDGRCSGCRNEMRIATYLAAFLSLRSAQWPKCVACMFGARRAA